MCLNNKSQIKIISLTMKHYCKITLPVCCKTRLIVRFFVLFISSRYGIPVQVHMPNLDLQKNKGSGDTCGGKKSTIVVRVCPYYLPHIRQW